MLITPPLIRICCQIDVRQIDLTFTLPHNTSDTGPTQRSAEQ